jgi:hypothetical protein
MLTPAACSVKRGTLRASSPEPSGTDQRPNDGAGDHRNTHGAQRIPADLQGGIGGEILGCVTGVRDLAARAPQTLPYGFER